MAKYRNDREGNFTVTVRWIDCVRPDAKRVNVQEACIDKYHTAGKAYEFALATQKRAASNYGICLVDLIIREDDKVVWTLR